MTPEKLSNKENTKGNIHSFPGRETRQYLLRKLGAECGCRREGERGGGGEKWKKEWRKWDGRDGGRTETEKRTEIS